MTDMAPGRRPTAAQCAQSLTAAFEASRGLPALVPDAAVAPDAPTGPVVPEPRSWRGKRLAISAAAVAVTAVAVVVANFAVGGYEAPAADKPVTPDAQTQVVTVTQSAVTVVQTPDGSEAPGVPGAPQPGASGVDPSTSAVETTEEEPVDETTKKNKEKKDRKKSSEAPTPSQEPLP